MSKPSKPLTIASCPIITNIEVMPGTRLVWLESPRIAATTRPGQFVMVRCGEDTQLRRPLSIHQVDGDKLALLFTIAGRGTHWLSERQRGDTVDIFGPLGNGFSVHPHSKNLLLVAGGIGIAPLRFLVNASLRQNKKVTLIMGATSAAYLMPISIPQRLFNNGVPPFNINVVNATDDGSEGFKGMATDLIAGYADGADQVFACGPVNMYRTMAQMPELKNKPVQLSLEIMMGCGVGVCYGCTIKTKRGLKQVCQDGPVFDFKDIIWEEFPQV
jgi:dihydroorotate dehydrogenase electron transfer subunit